MSLLSHGDIVIGWCWDAHTGSGRQYVQDVVLMSLRDWQCDKLNAINWPFWYSF